MFGIVVNESHIVIIMQFPNLSFSSIICGKYDITDVKLQHKNKSKIKINKICLLYTSIYISNYLTCMT